jgi:hypothetical protein
MISKKVFSFVEFINESYYNEDLINEEKESFIPTKEDIIKILEIQEKIGENYKSKFGEKKFQKAGKTDKQIWGSLESFNSLSEDLQGKAISDIQKAFGKKSIKKRVFDKIVKLFQEEVNQGSTKHTIKYSGSNQSVYVIVTKKTIEKTVPGKAGELKPPVKTQEIVLIDPLKASYFFKNNMYEIKEDNLGETFTDVEYTKQVLDLIDQKITEGYLAYKKDKNGGITKINIESSCSRYRNTAPSESLSWAELAYKRVGVFSKYVKAAAEKVSENNKEFVDKILSVTELGYFGSNGDGTSGPDPDKNDAGETVRKGYYVKKGTKSQFVDVKEGDLTMINVVDITPGENGAPVLGETPKKVKAKNVNGSDVDKAPSSPKDYDQFRFFQITMEGSFVETDEVTTKPEDTPPIVTVTEKYSTAIVFPSKRKMDLTINLPRRSKTKTKHYSPPKNRGRRKAVPCPTWD